MTMHTVRPKRRCGFAAMAPERVRAIASKGGKAAHEQGTAHRFTTEEAREAGRKGGLADHVRRGRQRSSWELAADRTEPLFPPRPAPPNDMPIPDALPEDEPGEADET